MGLYPVTGRIRHHGAIVEIGETIDLDDATAAHLEALGRVGARLPDPDTPANPPAARTAMGSDAPAGAPSDAPAGSTKGAAP